VDSGVALSAAGSGDGLLAVSGCGIGAISIISIVAGSSGEGGFRMPLNNATKISA
jgi:hypothetical protein